MQGSASRIEVIPKRFLSNQEAAEYLGVSREFLQNMREQAQISFYKHGKTIWYELKDLDKFVLKGKVI